VIVTVKEDAEDMFLFVLCFYHWELDRYFDAKEESYEAQKRERKYQL
jgi:hypothetical protein